MNRELSTEKEIISQRFSLDTTLLYRDIKYILACTECKREERSNQTSARTRSFSIFSDSELFIKLVQCSVSHIFTHLAD